MSWTAPAEPPRDERVRNEPARAEPVRVLLVDDHAVVREGYRRLLEREPGIQIVGEAAHAAEACERAAALVPDVVVMDIGLPGVSGIEATRRMLARRPDTRVLMFSMHDDGIFCTRALGAGAMGYVTKASAPEVLVQAVREIARGRRYVSPDVRQKTASGTAQRPGTAIASLTPRELEVLRLLARGETIDRISRALGLSEKTVANHQSAIREKLDVRNGAQLARLAAQLGLIV